MTDPQASKREPVDLKRNRCLVERLYRERREALRGVAARHGIIAAERDDVVHTAIAGVIGAYRGPADPDQLFSYAAAAVRNAAFKAHRRRARKESREAAIPTLEGSDRAATETETSFEDPEASDPLERAIAREDARVAGEAFARLPELEREILALGGAGYGNPEIAKITGLSERAVRKRVTRARKRLRGEL